MYKSVYDFLCFPTRFMVGFEGKHPQLNEGKHLVDPWGKALVTSGYVDYAKQPVKTRAKIYSEHYRRSSAVICKDLTVSASMRPVKNLKR